MDTEIVCIGGSAGALPSIEHILRRLREPVAVPVVVVLHRKASHPDALVATLQGDSQLPVKGIEDASPLTPGVVHVAPGGYHCLVGDGNFVLTLEPPEHFCIPSIDALFSTAGEQFGPAAAVIALSCANEDGAAGAALVKSRGGTVITQDLESVSHPVLIDAVIAMVEPDAILSPVAIGDWINTVSQSGLA